MTAGRADAAAMRAMAVRLERWMGISCMTGCGFLEINRGFEKWILI
jgi:hypothetical protein